MLNAQPISAPSEAIVAGEIVGSAFVIEKNVTIGCNCSIFSTKVKGKPLTELFAVKIEKDSIHQSVLNNEKLVIQSIKNSKHYAKIIESGRHKQSNYIVTQFLGPNLRDLALRQHQNTLTLQALMKFAYQAIEALQALHSAGFVHGAVNAKNFLIGYSKETVDNFYLIDFSTCIPYNYSDTTREFDLLGIMKIVQEYYSKEGLHASQNSQQFLPPEFQEFSQAIYQLTPKAIPDYSSLLQILIKTSMLLRNQDHVD
ncbi:MAG: hypothetical protein EZS28_023893 [Streblomastix strix]|uniref:Protein kinase domain-containing protein n=1 Tax=Streblomastix strix TaxID=222440 RepID=A0A5J4VDG1_9EUKA|nr:MAG: hypothetical protein EZS28_023893 [Streblomastix strix]